MDRKFKEALDKLGVTYNEDSGWLSECINVVVYKNRTFLPAERVFVIGDQLLILKKDSFRSVNSKNIVGFNLIKEA